MAFETDIFGTCTNDGLMICLAEWLNTITGGAFWTLFLISFMVVVFMGTYRYGSARAFSYAGVSGLFGSMLFVVVGLLSITNIIWFILIALASLAVAYVSNTR